MHKEIFSQEQVHLLPLVQRFSKDFFLVGGTAIALHLGHRRSIDFDLFSPSPFNNYLIRRSIARRAHIEKIYVDRKGELTMDVSRVRMTFFEYPFHIQPRQRLGEVIRFPDLLTLAAMKVYALGQRAKWKDHVDLYFITKKYGELHRITKKAKQIFGNEFNEKLLRVQLSYFDDIDYSEEVVYMKGHAVSDVTVRRALQKWSVRD